MKGHHRLSAVILILMLILFIRPVNIFGAESESEESEEIFGGNAEMIYINPIYADIVKEADLRSSKGTDISTASEEAVFHSIKEAGAEVRSHMKARNTVIEVNIRTLDPDWKTLTGAIVEEATAHTGNPVEGDYMKCHYGGFRVNNSWSLVEGEYQYKFTYTMTYFTDASQEAEMDVMIRELINKLNLTKMSSYEKIRTVYDYICRNVAYDYANLGNASYTLQYTAYAALKNKTAVCGGYSSLFYRIMLELGIDARVITGTCSEGAHAWNIVKLEGKYYDLDSTWDAGRGQPGNEYQFFLKCDADFGGHVRGAGFAGADFYAAYPMGEESYVLLGCTGHKEVTDPAVAPTCLRAGKTEGKHCSVCGEVFAIQREIPALGHKWSAWKTISSATVFAGEVRSRTCSVCKTTEQRTVGGKLKPSMKVTAAKLPLKRKQVFSAFRVTGMKNGDFVASWKSSNTKIFKVSGKANGTCRITAQNKCGTARLTITLKSGLKKTITIKVQQSGVKTTKITGVKKKVTLKKGKRLTLAPVLTPVSSKEKITYKSSNTKVASVSSKGKITARKKGTAVITVKAGKISVKCRVTVK